jgi:DEAD/DEAH box helicase domain-containing protein
MLHSMGTNAAGAEAIISTTKAGTQLSDRAMEIISGYRGLGEARWSSVLPGRDAMLAALPSDVPPALREALAAAGRTSLYLHQLETIERVRAGDDVLLVTSTASGKTLAFNAAILDRLLQHPSERAIYLYPLNALANDQRHSIEDLVAKLPTGVRPRVGLITGQASVDEKRSARDAHLILTNPETLHFSVLRRPDLWRTALGQLRFLVIDEAHMYRGAFGAHVSHVVRRLLRLAGAAGAKPQLIAASATIGNPAELGSLLTAREFKVIDRDGSPKPDRELIVWDPPVFDSGSRGSYEAEAVALLIASLRAGRSAILFARSRRGVESLTSDIVEQLDDPELAETVRPYRGGYTPGERKSIEDGLRSGAVRAVVTTNALEVGIDIGSLDVAIIAGYPGTMMAFWQQAGRAGRRGRSSQIFFVPSANPLDEFFASDPRRLLETPHELATFDPWNPRVAVDHVIWRAMEAPIRAAGPWEADAARRIVERLEEQGALRRQGSGLVAAAPHPYDVSMRSLEGRPFRITDMQGHEIGEVDEQYLYRECHPGAIYPHRGQAFRVLSLDERERRVLVKALGPWTDETKVTVISAIREVQELARRQLGPEHSRWEARLARIEVTDDYVEYREGPRKRLRDTPIPIDPPLRRTRPTVGLLLDLPTVHPAAAHAIEHALVGMVPTEVMCDRRDFVGLTSGTSLLTVTLYDRNIEGLGFAERAFERLPAIAAAAAERLASCRCDDGCPLCIQSPGCERWNQALDKTAASLALDAVLGIQRTRHIASRAERPRGLSTSVARSVADSLVEEQRASSLRDLEERIRGRQPGWESDEGWTRTDYVPGMDVSHPAFGLGSVREVISNQLGMGIVIDFGSSVRRIVGGEGNLAVRTGESRRR